MLGDNPITDVIVRLRRVRVRQGDTHIALSLLAQQVDLLIGHDQSVSKIALEIKSEALRLSRAGPSVPRFVIEDLLHESIARLEQAQMAPAAER
jgi:hypothetical protein